ncbi:MAG: hypothetical protein PHS93_00835 [Candidatus Omnitrophica bacterium]|nr:hypothetical protein [Candidatus Omnitrophota bacterium]MDD5351698.1 hypothetical protein [Candidatus Omnitrophota bacterium]MDD5550908.1 hypothetical protein [Candidatus Omnitrophota bacterium]
MFKRILITLLLMTGLSLPAYAELSSGNFTLAGYVKNETSLTVNGSGSTLSKFKNMLELSGEYDIKGQDLVFFMKTRYWYDSAYDWNKKYDCDRFYVSHDQRSNWLRDFYVDYTNGPWFLRLGKQQVAWGQADGITILDRVNPVDLTEFWLPDMADMRIPLWMANINYSPKLNANLQFLFIPDFEGSTAAPPNAPFAFRSTNVFGSIAIPYNLNVQTRYPGKQFDNSTFGLQWQDRIGDLTYTLNFLNGYYYNARTLQIGTVTNRSFKRWRMYGGSMNKTFTNPGPMQGVTMRGDFAYYNDEPIYYGNPTTASTSGFKRWDNIFWLIGFDKTFFTNWVGSFQFSQYIMQDAKIKDKGITAATQYPLNSYTYGAQDQVENIFTLKISTDFLHERLKPEILWSLTDDNQGRLAPKITYEIKDNVWWTVGAHYFYGSEYDTNGQFRDANQVYTQLKITF